MGSLFSEINSVGIKDVSEAKSIVLLLIERYENLTSAEDFLHAFQKIIDVVIFVKYYAPADRDFPDCWDVLRTAVSFLEMGSLSYVRFFEE